MHHEAARTFGHANGTIRMYSRASLMIATALTGSVLISHHAGAQDASQLSAIQSQISQLQTQLKRLQRQAAARDEALRSAQADAAQARADAAQAVSRTATFAAASRGVPLSSPPGYYPQGPAPATGFALAAPNPNASSLGSSSPSSITTTSVDANNPTFRLGGVTITLGGFIDDSVIYRSRNLTSGTSTSYNAIPFSDSANAHVSEFRMSSQNTRFSVLAQGKPGDGLALSGYLEGDFDGAATTSNSNQSNSYTPRMRQAYVAYDDQPNGWHVLAGQTFSLATGSTVGITPRKESLPPTIDNNYVAGFVYTRQAQIRLVKDFGHTLWLGASVEGPQETFSGFTSGSALPDGQTLYYNSTGGTYLNSTTTYSFDSAPDMIVKAAFDPGFGHYEVYGLGRFFRSRTDVATGTGQTHTVFGGGVGGSTVIPILPKFVDFVGNVLAGDGIGRYATSQLPDATFDAQGNPIPLRQISALAGLVAHPGKSVDIYGFAGMEQNHGSTFDISTTSKGKTTTTGYGYGSPLANTIGCDVEDTATSLCSAQTRAIDDISIGAWWRFIHGGFGTVQAGFQYSYIKRIAYSGVGGRPSTDDNVALFTIRFLPFQ